MGKPTKGNQKGAQTHAEGQHGDVTLDALQKNNSAPGATDETQPRRGAHDPNRPGAERDTAQLHEGMVARGEGDGGHRLMEGRQQHDEAEKNSEKNRLEIDVERHKHDREQFQIRGGAEGHPKA